jgi:hypothetical protein
VHTDLYDHRQAVHDVSTSHALHSVSDHRQADAAGSYGATCSDRSQANSHSGSAEVAGHD